MKIKILFTNDIQHNFCIYESWYSLSNPLSPINAWQSIVEYITKDRQDKFLFLPEKFLTISQQRQLVNFLVELELSKNITIFSLSPSISHGNTELLIEV